MLLRELVFRTCTMPLPARLFHIETIHVIYTYKRVGYILSVIGTEPTMSMLIEILLCFLVKLSLL